MLQKDLYKQMQKKIYKKLTFILINNIFTIQQLSPS